MGVYSFRHKVNTIMRLAHVPAEQRSLQLGHRRPDLRTADGYGEWHPTYMREATAAIEAWTRRILAKAKIIERQKRANSHGIPTTTQGTRRKAA